MKVTEPGIYAMTADAYHADPCPEPSLSASMANILETQSPEHAWTAHPRLNPAHDQGEVTAEQEAGTALHALIIEGRDIIESCAFRDWKTDAAKKRRAWAREEGLIPILAPRAAQLRACAEVVRAKLGRHEARDVFAGEGQAEAVMVWQEDAPWGRIWCRSRVDWLGAAWIDDLKTTGGTAHPETWRKKIVPSGYALQRAFYLRGARALGRRPRDFRFIVVEQDPPHDLNVITLAGDLAAIGDAQADRAIEAWSWSMHHGQWPGSPPKIVRVDASSWELAQHEERQARRPFNAGTDGRVANAGMPFA